MKVELERMLLKQGPSPQLNLHSSLHINLLLKHLVSQPSSSLPTNRASTPQVATRAHWYFSSSQPSFHVPRET